MVINLILSYLIFGQTQRRSYLRHEDLILSYLIGFRSRYLPLSIKVAVKPTMLHMLASSTFAFSGVSKLAASRVAAPRVAPAQMFTVNLVTPDGPQTVRSMHTHHERTCMGR